MQPNDTAAAVATPVTAAKLCLELALVLGMTPFVDSAENRKRPAPSQTEPAQRKRSPLDSGAESARKKGPAAAAAAAAAAAENAAAIAAAAAHASAAAMLDQMKCIRLDSGRRVSELQRLGNAALVINFLLNADLGITNKCRRYLVR